MSNYIVKISKFRVNFISVSELKDCYNLIFNIWDSLDEAESQVLEHELNSDMKSIYLSAINKLRKYGVW